MVSRIVGRQSVDIEAVAYNTVQAKEKGSEQLKDGWPNALKHTPSPVTQMSDDRLWISMSNDTQDVSTRRAMHETRARTVVVR